MASHAAVSLVSETPVPGTPVRVEAVLKLACGCTVTRVIAADRVAETTSGERIPVGKYPCPEGHPVNPPRKPPLKGKEG